MSKCSNCGKESKKLSSYGDVLLCKDCAGLYGELWLIRTTDGRILGPYPNKILKDLISDKKIVFLDEVSRPGDDWELVKNVEAFRDVALKTNYDLSDATMDIDITKPPIYIDKSGYKKPSKKPPSFKARQEKPASTTVGDFVDKFIPKGVLIQSGAKGTPVLTPWWKNKKFVLIAAGVALVFVWSLSLYFIRGMGEETKITSSSMTAGSEGFNKYYIEGREFENGGLFTDALKDYTKALSIRPQHSGARIRKAGIELSALDNRESAQKELEQLYSQVNIGKITDPEEQTDIKTFLGILEYKKGNMQSAIGYFNQALATRPTNPFVYYNMAMVFFKQGNYLEAIEYLRNAQKLLPAFSDAVIFEGLALMKLGRFRKAYKVFSSAVVQNPNIREFYTLGAYSAYRSIGAEKAYDILRRITNLDPYYGERVFSPLAQIKRDPNITSEINLISEVIKDFSPDRKRQGQYIRAFLYLTSGDYAGASRILASFGQEESPVGQLILGIISYNQNNMGDAKKRIYKSLELDYSNNIAHMYAGQIAIRKQNLSQAKNHFIKAQASDEATSLYAITLLGDINVRMGDMNQAMMLWKRALSFDSRYVPAWERILKVGRKNK